MNRLKVCCDMIKRIMDKDVLSQSTRDNLAVICVTLNQVITELKKLKQQEQPKLFDMPIETDETIPKDSFIISSPITGRNWSLRKLEQPDNLPVSGRAAIEYVEKELQQEQPEAGHGLIDGDTIIVSGGRKMLPDGEYKVHTPTVPKQYHGPELVADREYINENIPMEPIVPKHYQRSNNDPEPTMSKQQVKEYIESLNFDEKIMLINMSGAVVQPEKSDEEIAEILKAEKELTYPIELLRIKIKLMEEILRNGEYSYIDGISFAIRKIDEELREEEK